jgi:hypothetical protein
VYLGSITKKQQKKNIEKLNKQKTELLREKSSLVR